MKKNKNIICKRCGTEHSKKNCFNCGWPENPCYIWLSSEVYGDCTKCEHGIKKMCHKYGSENKDV